MRVLMIIIFVIVKIVLIPFTLIDWLFIGLPREIKARKWRKNAKVGDKGYFINILGDKTYFDIEKIDRRRKEAFSIRTRGFASTSYQSISPDNTYPARD